MVWNRQTNYIAEGSARVSMTGDDAAPRALSAARNPDRKCGFLQSVPQPLASRHKNKPILYVMGIRSPSRLCVLGPLVYNNTPCKDALLDDSSGQI